MKFTQKLSKTNKIIISVALGAGVALGVGFVAGVSNTTTSASIDIMGSGTKIEMRVNTGYANFGEGTLSSGADSEPTNMNPEKLSFPEFIKSLTDTMKPQIDAGKTALAELEKQLQENPSMQEQIQPQIEVAKQQIKFYEDTIAAWNTSYTLMIVGSVILGVFGIAGIAWSTMLLLDKKSKPTA